MQCSTGLFKYFYRKQFELNIRRCIQDDDAEGASRNDGESNKQTNPQIIMNKKEENQFQCNK